MTTVEHPLIYGHTAHARYAFLPEGQRSGALRVVCAGYEEVSADYVVNRPGFRYAAIECVAAGQGSLELAGQSHPLSAGVVFAYGPRTPHRIETDPSERLVKYFVDFTGPGAAALLRGAGLARTGLSRCGDMDGARELFEALIRNGQRGGQRGAAICAHLVRALALLLAADAVAPESVRSPAYATYQRARDLLEQRALALGSVAALARATHVDAAYLSRLFRRFGRVSPSSELQRLRLGHAAALLRQPGAMVKNVARACGYLEPAHFSRAFRLHYGVSPAHFAERRAAARRLKVKTSP